MNAFFYLGRKADSIESFLVPVLPYNIKFSLPISLNSYIFTYIRLSTGCTSFISDDNHNTLPK